MSPQTTFDDRWHRFDDFVVSEAPPSICSYAQKFAEWADQLLDASQAPSIVTINQAKVLLLDKYFEWYIFVPNSHRRRVNERGHTCIYQVFTAAYKRLKVIELSLTPPLLFLPPLQPASLPAPQIAGIFLGGVEEE